MRRYALSLAILTASISAGLIVHAQQSATERMRLPIGSIVEIMAENSYSNPSYTWTLTQDQTFLDSSRQPVFQARLNRLGTHTITAEVVSGDGSTRAMRDFVIDVRERQPEDNALPSLGGQNDVVTFDPVLDANNRVVLGNNSHILRLSPARRDVKQLALDLDTGVDSNGDGNPLNDDDTRDTLFRSNTHPIIIWFVQPKPQQSLRLGALFTNNQTFFQPFDVVTESYAQGQDRSNGTITRNRRIQVSAFENGTVQYSLGLETDASHNVLYQWDFGDGQQSLMSQPVHAYAEKGTYVVRVIMRDLDTGTELMNVSESVNIDNVQQQPASGNGDTRPANEGGSLFVTVLKMLGYLILFAVLGAVAVFVFSKIRRGWSLEKTVEKAEKTLVGDAAQKEGDVTVEPPPMEIKSNEKEETPAPPHPIDSAQDAVVEAEVVEPTETMPEKEEPVPKPETPPPPPPTPATPSTPSEPPAPKASDAPLPDWLQPQDQAEPSPSPTPSSEPPAPNVEHTAMEPSAEQLAEQTPPAAQAEEAPSWLQAGLEKAEEKGQTAATPPPPTLDTSPPPPPPAAPETPKAQTPSPSPNPSDEAERERKRKKRQRYRANKKKREAEEAKKEGPVVSEDSKEKGSDGSGDSTIAAPADKVSGDKPSTTSSSEPNAPSTPPSAMSSEPNGDTDEPIAIIRADSIEEQQPKSSDGTEGSEGTEGEKAA